MRLALLLLAVAGAAQAQEETIQRALLELDQRTVEFAARVRGASGAELRALEALGARQVLGTVAADPGTRRPDARIAARRETEAFLLRLAPPVERRTRAEGSRPLPPDPPCSVDVVPDGEVRRCR